MMMMTMAMMMAMTIRCPKGHKIQGHNISWHSYRGRRAKRGDLDNRVKILLDALAGTLFRNDRQIATIHAQRVDQHATLQRGFMRVTLERVKETFEYLAV